MSRYGHRSTRTVRPQGAFAKNVWFVDDLPYNRAWRGREAVPEPFKPRRPNAAQFGRFARPARLPPRVPMPRIIPAGFWPVAVAFSVAEFADSLFVPNPNYVPPPTFAPTRPEHMWDYRHGPNTYAGTNYWPKVNEGQNNGIAYVEAGKRGPETGKITGQSNWHLVDGPPGYPVASFHDQVSYVIPQRSGNTNLTAQTHAWIRNTSANYGPLAPRMPAKWHTFPNPMREPVSKPSEWPSEDFAPTPAPHPGELPWVMEPAAQPNAAMPREAGSKPPLPGVKEIKKISRAAKFGIAAWGIMDSVSELSEIAGGFYKALPEKVREKWGCAKGLNIGQYGSDTNRCQLAALWHNWHLLDTEQAFLNVAKNIAEDMTIGQFHKWLSKLYPPGISLQRTAVTHGLSKTEFEAYVAKRLKDLFKFLGLEE